MRPAGRWRLSSRVPAVPVLVAALLVAAVLCPVVFIVQMSFRTGHDAFRMPPTLVFSPTLHNYVDLVEGKFVRSLANSAVTATSTTVLALVLGVAAAYTVRRAPLPVDLLHPDGAGHRVRYPLFPDLQRPGVDRHPGRPGGHLPDLQPLARHLDDAGVLRR